MKHPGSARWPPWPAWSGNPLGLVEWNGHQKKFPNWEVFLDPTVGTSYIEAMRIVALQTLKRFYEVKGNASSGPGIKSWYAEAKNAEWKGSKDIKSSFPHASFLKNNRVVFNAGGNKYRIVVHVHYKSKIVFVRFVGTHADYDKIDAETV